MTASVYELPLFQQKQLPLYPSHDQLLGVRLNGLIAILADRQWHTSKELKVHGFNDRELRELVEHSDGRVFSHPGSPGYKLFEAITIDEFEAGRALLNQGKAMIRRWSRYNRRFHRGT